MCRIPAYYTGIPGLYVHRLADDPLKWTCAHASGFRVGGIFNSVIEALDMVNDHFNGLKIDWCRAIPQLRADTDAWIAVISFKAKYL